MSHSKKFVEFQGRLIELPDTNLMAEIYKEFKAIEELISLKIKQHESTPEGMMAAMIFILTMRQNSDRVYSNYITPEIEMQVREILKATIQ